MADKPQTTQDFRLVSVMLHKPGDIGKPFDMKDLVDTFSYVESVTSPCVAATMNIVDSAGLLSTWPIQGMETIEIKLIANPKPEEEKLYRFKIWRLTNRVSSNQKQTYTLGLVSEEALLNETNRTEGIQSGNPNAIVEKMIKEKLTSSKMFYSEPSAFKVKMIASRKRPFDVITDVCVKSVPTSGISAFETSSKKDKPTIKGSAGFLFWETRRGYHFFSVDALCATGEKNQFKSKNFQVDEHGTYKERPANQENIQPDTKIIETATFQSEIDIMSSLRTGKYASLICMFNYSTGQYEEFPYDINQTYDNMAHLGGQESVSKLPHASGDLSEKPTRIMSVLVDHESWYNLPGPASPEDKDGSTDPTEFADWQKHYVSQALTRYELLKNQSGTIVIPGNSDICAGDRITLELVNKAPSADIKKNPLDKETSGVYLIEEVTHTYEKNVGTNGRFRTTVRVMRDSYGMPDEVSSHGN
tara:strand:- start:108 stop:1526 length:1419 start_codon:yes stop_codon:yes gene_type:complete